jgi:Endonuclease NucS
VPIRTTLWEVGPNPQLLTESSLTKEQLLEDMIVAAPRILSEEWMLIGRQEDTGFGGRIDLLAIAPDGSLVLIELKRDRTPREVVAQSIDYAVWLEKLHAEEIAAIYGRFAPGKSLAEDFRRRFGQTLDEDGLNQSHQIIIVAASLDDSTERIVAYLSERDIPINVLCFQIFTNGAEQLLSGTWLLDPVRTQVSAAATPVGPSEPWNGEFYCSYGHSETRSWDDATEFGFICGGGGPWYSKTLQLLGPGDRVWVNVPGSGFVGVGRVTGRSQPASTFMVNTSKGEFRALDVVKRGSYHREFIDDPERCEYFVPVQWLQTVRLEDAVREIGMFGNQNTVCKPTTPKWRSTIERLKEKFPNYDEAPKTPQHPQSGLNRVALTQSESHTAHG